MDSLSHAGVHALCTLDLVDSKVKNSLFLKESEPDPCEIPTQYDGDKTAGDVPARMIEHADEFPHAGERKCEVYNAFQYHPPAKKSDETAPIRSKRRVRYRDGKPRDKFDECHDEYECATVPEFRDRRDERLPADHDDNARNKKVEPEKFCEEYRKLVHET